MLRRTVRRDFDREISGRLRAIRVDEDDVDHFGLARGYHLLFEPFQPPGKGSIDHFAVSPR